jgi:hypothetical protein
VRTIDEFRKNLATRFLSTQWLDAIDFSKFVIVGSSVINALCRSSLADPKEHDINLIHLSVGCALDFITAVTKTITKLQTIASKYSKHEINVEQTPGSLRFDVHLPCGVKLNFLDMSIFKNSKDPLSSILHSFDMDICQVVFTGSYPYFTDKTTATSDLKSIEVLGNLRQSSDAQ